MEYHENDPLETDNSNELSRIERLFDELFPICRSITGPGLRKSLRLMQREIPLDIEGISSGTDVFDWTIPQEWHVHSGRLVGPDDQVYADFEETNLAVVNYSEPINQQLLFSELRPHLYSIEELPQATPYITSYYERNWGFCIPHDTLVELPKGKYRAVIDSEFVDGELNYGHTVLEGETDQEVLLSSYLCHPSMANNELSGPLVMALLYNRIQEWDEQHYTYRFVLCPETIGSLTYLSRYGDHLQEQLVGGLVLTCLGGPDETLKYKRSRRGDARLDRLVDQHEKNRNDIIVRSFSEMFGSDERQYCSPGFDLPVGQVARTVYGRYPEYHTSGDDREFMGFNSLLQSVNWIEELLRKFEYAGVYRNLEPHGEPMLSKRDLFPTVSEFAGDSHRDKTSSETDAVSRDEFLKRILLVLQYSDGDHDMIEIAEKRDLTVGELLPIVRRLQDTDLLEQEQI
ncbi:DUF4910 domain-containing protein [Halomontanus rarus]|uniref:DUF4910 domain-containing protein n=1 Tax=Halomontanus rarus TaxID=3034020 RepID=UPI0023E8639B|nr:DUF4910 domain-containing protein [Halovivax sp. TS33]